MRGLRCLLMHPNSDIFAVAVQDKSDIKMSKTISIAGNNLFNCDTRSETLIHPKDTSSSNKVRKTYTITKQREKWTEEEHQRFLEALKLYGRGWRQIEEHVGTKTAVQIRSHAQKFFSKLERESNGCAENPIQQIVIPPPRPKRKPLHPYPRKVVNFCHGSSILNEQERSLSCNKLVAEKETHSPTSVLSDAFGSTISEQTVRSLPPNSCHTEMNSMSLSNIEKDNDYLTSNSSEEEKTSWSSVPQSGGASLENLFSLSFESYSEGTKFSKGITENVQSSTSIKLFGRAISVPNVEKPLRVGGEDLKSVAWMQSQVYAVVTKEKLGLQLQPHLDVQLSLGMSCSNSNSPLGGDKMNPMEDQKETYTTGSFANVSLPSWTFPHGLSTLNSEPCNETETPTPIYACLRERMDNKKGVEETFLTGSCSWSFTEFGSGDKSSIEHSDNQEPNTEVCIGVRISREPVGTSPHRSTRGCMPYKRCLSERNAESLGSALEEREGQRARVCS